jgi:ADP-heptose:LPS heptosyltransferase
MKPSPAYYFQNAPAILARFAGASLFSLVRVTPAGRKLLVVKLDALGDQVLFAVILSYLREAFRGYAVTLLVQESMTEFYRNCPHVDRVLGLNRDAFYRDARYAFRRMRELRRERFAAVVHPTWSRDVAADQLATSSGAPRIVAAEGDAANQPAFLKRCFDAMYTEVITEREPRSVFEGHRYMAVPAHFGVPATVADWRPVVWFGDEDQAAAARLLNHRRLGLRGFAVLAPGAGEKVKCWPPERFAALGDWVFDELGLGVLLAGAPSETGLARMIRSGMRAPCHSVAGETTISVLAALIARAAIVVGNDSGPIHLAMATGTPAVCIVGGGHGTRFLPYPGDHPLRCVTRRQDCFGCGWSCTRPEPSCITGVSVEDVQRAIVELRLRG